MDARTATLQVRLKQESMDALRALAEKERRTVSDMARYLLLEGMHRMEKRR